MHYERHVNTRLMVWNPYSGLILRIPPTQNFRRLDRYCYALGYGCDKSIKSYKILRFIDHDDGIDNFVEFNIYDFNSGSWRVLDVTPQDWDIFFSHHGVSLKGNTYWFATEKYSETKEEEDSFLVCFDFTSETFGPSLPLPLPFELYDSEDTVSLSIVREEQLVLLHQPWDTLTMKIWVTTKIEPNAVSWNSHLFLTANIQQLIQPQFQFTDASFFIDEEKQVAVVSDKGKDVRCPTPNNIAYIFGVDGSLKEVDLGECADELCYPRVCSYVPSLVQLN
ncbi:F-box protein [Cardamine amara subsp. amara]|uniref:F-box protein n=1 Tax=Cardamine amara subsp. amara TaxID=228776 RepID=A0ABD0ZBG2_CARAN